MSILCKLIILMKAYLLTFRHANQMLTIYLDTRYLFSYFVAHVVLLLVVNFKFIYF